MSREAEYRAHAARVRALAEGFSDDMSRKSLLQAAACWLLLADMEAAAGPDIRWDHSPVGAAEPTNPLGDERLASLRR